MNFELNKILLYDFQRCKVLDGPNFVSPAKRSAQVSSIALLESCGKASGGLSSGIQCSGYEAFQTAGKEPVESKRQLWEVFI